MMGCGGQREERIGEDRRGEERQNVPQRIGKSGDGQLSGFGVAQAAEGVEAAEDAGVGLLGALALVLRHAALAALGQTGGHFKACTVL